MKVFVEGRSTHDARLFAAIAAMGVPWDSDNNGAVDGGVRVWLFGETSDCGLWSTKKLLAWWRDKDFHVKNPSHPFHVVKAVMASDRGLREAFRNFSGFQQVKRGDSQVIMPCDENFTVKESWAKNPTPDAAFAASASAVGFAVVEGKSQGSRRIMSISDRSSTYPYTFKEIQHWWRFKEFEGENPQHPFAYAKAVAINYLLAIDAIKRDRPLVKWRPKNGIGTAFIHPDCSSETESEVAEWFNPK